MDFKKNNLGYLGRCRGRKEERGNDVIIIWKIKEIKKVYSSGFIFRMKFILFCVFCE